MSFNNFDSFEEIEANINSKNLFEKLEKIIDINILGKWKAFKIHHKGPRIKDFEKYIVENNFNKENEEDVENNIFSIDTKNEIFINPHFNWTFPKQLETKHFFIVGAPGSGKTQLIMPWVHEVRKRMDKVILYDNKGDFTEVLKPIQGNKIILVAPWDKRGVAWEIGKDIFNIQLAREFATKVIPDAEEPIYTSSARLLLVGAISYLQENYGITWTFSELYDVLTLPREKLYNIMVNYYPQAAELIRSETKLAQNIMTNLLAGIDMIGDLAEIWKNTPNERRFSVRELINSKEPFTLILQGSGTYREMANALIGSIIMSAASEIETLSDDNERKIWFFLDEFPQLGFLPGFTPLLEIGRSKGVRVVLAMQNINQLIEIYGEETAKSIQAMCNTQFYSKLPLGSTATFISDFLGEREILKIVPRLNNHMYMQDYVVSIEYEKSVPEFILSNELGAKKDGIYMLMVGLTNDHLLIKFPYSFFEKIRPKNIWADWTKAN